MDIPFLNGGAVRALNFPSLEIAQSGIPEGGKNAFRGIDRNQVHRKALRRSFLLPRQKTDVSQIDDSPFLRRQSVSFRRKMECGNPFPVCFPRCTELVERQDNRLPSRPVHRQFQQGITAAVPRPGKMDRDGKGFLPGSDGIEVKGKRPAVAPVRFLRCDLESPSGEVRLEDLPLLKIGNGGDREFPMNFPLCKKVCFRTGKQRGKKKGEKKKIVFFHICFSGLNLKNQGRRRVVYRAFSDQK